MKRTLKILLLLFTGFIIGIRTMLVFIEKELQRQPLFDYDRDYTVRLKESMRTA